MIGRELQKELSASLGDEFEIFTNTGEIKKLKITGFYDLKVASLNRSWMLTTLETSQSISSIMIQVFVLVAVVLGIASVLAITVIQKSKQIGILKAMGLKDRTASLI